MNMATTLTEAVSCLYRMGFTEITDFEMEEDSVLETYINHKHRNEVIVPYIAVRNNIRFGLHKGDRYVITSDGVRCKVVECKEAHICNLEDKVKELYGIDCWKFIQRWYKVKESMGSMYFFYMRLEKA